jgi:RNA polymerase sigma-70 factor (ECF subfamily)
MSPLVEKEGNTPLESGRDEKIVEACLAGDGRAYAGLVRLHGKRVYAICLAMTGNAADAEDMTQETLMRGFTELASLRDHDRFGPWIAAIAGNACRNFIRGAAGALLPKPAWSAIL